MPALLLVDFSAQTQRTGGGIRGGGGTGDRIPCEEIRPDDHQLTLAEILAVGFHLGNGLTAPCADISESAQLLTDGCQCNSHLFGIQSRHTENTRFNTGYRLRRQQGFQSGVLTVFVGGADDIGNGLREFRFLVITGAVFHAHDNGDRF
ncbi:Uncharacterised protein [Escherichia coli]|nr:Uncharacterised protein [Escherichia coli]